MVYTVEEDPHKRVDYHSEIDKVCVTFALGLYLFSPVNKVVLWRHLPALGSDNKKAVSISIVAAMCGYSLLVKELDQSFNQNEI